MDTSDIAAAALKPDGRGRCSCARHTKSHNPDRRCPKCHGTGMLTACLTCGGSGWNPKANKMCQNCQGCGFTDIQKRAEQ